MNQIDIEGIRERQHTYAIMASYGCEATKWTAAVQFADYACEVFPALLDAHTEQAAEIARLEGLVERTAAERDTAIYQLSKMHLCRHCINAERFLHKKPPCDACADSGKPDWQWCGFSEREGVRGMKPMRFLSLVGILAFLILYFFFRLIGV